MCLLRMLCSRQPYLHLVAGHLLDNVRPPEQSIRTFAEQSSIPFEPAT